MYIMLALLLCGQNLICHIKHCLLSITTLTLIHYFFTQMRIFLHQTP